MNRATIKYREGSDTESSGYYGEREGVVSRPIIFGDLETAMHFFPGAEIHQSAKDQNESAREVQ